MVGNRGVMLKTGEDVRMDTDRQVAAMCVARLFQGMGHKIRQESGSGIGYQAEGSSQLTDYEKKLLKEAFDFFVGLMKGDGSK